MGERKERRGWGNVFSMKLLLFCRVPKVKYQRTTTTFEENVLGCISKSFMHARLNCKVRGPSTSCLPCALPLIFPLETNHTITKQPYKENPHLRLCLFPLFQVFVPCVYDSLFSPKSAAKAQAHSLFLGCV